MEISRIDKVSVYYVSIDGKTFETKEDCQKWEKELAIEKEKKKMVKKVKKMMKQVRKICKVTKCSECPFYDEKQLDCLFYMYPEKW